MTRADATLARHRLARAEQTLRTAQSMVREGDLLSAVNRAYYAAFYAARALLATKRLDSAKHSGVLSLLGQHFVKPGMISREHGRAINDLFELRLQSDYRDFTTLEPDEVRNYLRKAEAFVAAVRQALEPLLQDRED